MKSRGNKSLLSGPTFLFTSRLSSQLIVPLVSLLVIRYFGPELFGLYACSLAISVFLSILCDFGFQSTILYYLADPRFPFGSVLQVAFKLNSLFIVFAVVVLIVWVHAVDFATISINVAYILSGNFFRIGIVTIITSGLQNRGEYSRIAFWNFLIAIVYSIATLILICLKCNVYIVIGMPLLVALIGSLFMLIIEGKRFGLFHFYLKTQKVSIIAFLSSTSKFGASQAMHRVYHNSDVALLSAIRQSNEVGQFSVAFRMVEFVNVIPAIVFNQILYPKFFLWSKSRREHLLFYSQMTIKLMFYLGSFISANLLIFSPEIITIVSGVNDKYTIVLLSIMSWAIPLRFIASSPGAVLTTAGYIKNKLRIQTCVAFANVLLNLVFIPIYGAIASACILVATDLAISLSYLKQIGIKESNPIPTSFLKYVGFCLSINAVLWRFCQASSFFTKTFLVLLVFIVTTVCASYSTNINEKNEIIRLFNAKV